MGYIRVHAIAAVLAGWLVQVDAVSSRQAGDREQPDQEPVSQEAVAPSSDGGVHWRTDLALATVEAKRDQRPLLVVFR